MRVFASLLLVAQACAFMGGNALAATRASASKMSMSSLADFEAAKLDGSMQSLSEYVGKPVLVVNVASLWGTTVRDFNAMNDLVDKFGDQIAVLGFCCNQFGHQTNEGDGEFLNTLKHVRPGDGFEPKCELFGKTNVNGANAAPLFKWLKNSIMIPGDELGDRAGNGCDDIDALILPRGAFDATTVSLWSPVCRSDIAWNFEKFLLDAEGTPVKRYSRYFQIPDIASDIEEMLK